jgi:tyrosyl-tRNA synthetase
MSFTEFSYQLIQGYDFLFLNQNYDCKVQMGGSDQWGNITTGTELIRRKAGGESFAITCPLITKADGGKFGKTESGNIWLSPEKTSPYEFYQFWVNTSDLDAEKYIKIFTILELNKIENLIKEHQNAPHLRNLQKKLAEELTILVHSKEDFQVALDASEILFGNSTKEKLINLNENILLKVFEGLPSISISKEKIENGIPLMIFLTEDTNIFPSKAELRRIIQGNSLSINKEKLLDEYTIINCDFLLKNKYILIQKGKKNYYLVVAE